MLSAYEILDSMKRKLPLWLYIRQQNLNILQRCSNRSILGKIRPYLYLQIKQDFWQNDLDQFLLLGLRCVWNDWLSNFLIALKLGNPST